MNPRCLALGLLLLAPLSQLHGQKVTTDYDHSTNFENYKTYAWIQGTPIRNQLWDQRIIEGIDQQLSAKGLRKLPEGEKPDMYVLYHGAVGQEAEVNTMSTGGWGWRWGGGMATTTVNKIPVGQLVVDLGDANSKKLLWMASASDTLSDNPDKNRKKLDKTLAKMFQKFPPPPAK